MKGHMRCIDDYINGNLTDAKKGAKRVSYKAIRDSLQDNYGKSLSVACAIADYLKGMGTYQHACDAELKEGK